MIYFAQRNLRLVEGVLETVGCSAQVQFSLWEESVWTLCGFLVVDLWNVVVLLRLLTLLRLLRLLIFGSLRLIVVVDRCCWCWTTHVSLFTLAAECWVVPAFIVASQGEESSRLCNSILFVLTNFVLPSIIELIAVVIGVTNLWL